MKISLATTFFSKINVSVILLFTLLGNQSLCQNVDNYSIRRVVIDAGHGGKDPGAIGKFSVEKDIALKIALKVGTYIETYFPDVKVIYTRNKDIFIPVDERSRIANDANADLFISIHCNSNASRVPYGTETYVMGLSKSDANLDVAMRENAVITYEDDYSSKYEGYDPSSSESFIIFSMIQNAYLDQSLNFASLIQTDFTDRANRKDRGVKQERFLVLWKTSMPSVLVEVGFISNPKEEVYLNSAEGQEHLASSIYRAFKVYKKSIDEKNAIAAKNNFNHSIHNSVEQNPVQLSSQWDSNQSELNSIVFKVQVLVSSKKLELNPNQFKDLKNVEEIQSNGLFKYCVGSMKSYNDILAYCQEVKKLYPDAFVIALKGGSQIPIDTAIKELSKQ